MYPEVHFPKEATSRWSGVESQVIPKSTKATVFSLEFLLQWGWPRATIWCPWGRQQTFTRVRHTPQPNWRLSPNLLESQIREEHKAKARIHNLIGGSWLIPIAHKATKTTTSFLSSNEHKSNENRRLGGGIWNSFGGSVDLGLLGHSSKYQGIRNKGVGNLWVWSFFNNGGERASLSWMGKMAPFYTPHQ